MLNRLEKYLGKFAIHNLTIYLVILSAIVTGFNITYGGDIGVVTPGDFTAENLINLILFPFNIADRWIVLGIYLYMLLIFGQLLENEIGAFHYNVYMITGITLVTLGAFVLPGLVTTDHIYISILFAIAYIVPNYELLLFFILPVKIKWIALITAALMLVNAVRLMVGTGSFFYILGFILPAGNFFLYFGRDIFSRSLTTSKSISRRAKIKSTKPASIHRCEICGKTELDDPRMDFRFCIECVDHEYCSEHLHSHEHIKGE